jgi:hypothetical protein
MVMIVIKPDQIGAFLGALMTVFAMWMPQPKLKSQVKPCANPSGSSSDTISEPATP